MKQAAADASRLDHKTLEAVRIRAVQRVRAGESPEAVIRALGFNPRCVYNWLAAYRSGGWDALRASKLEGRLKKVKQFIESTQGRLRRFFLPRYSPELNPDELVWNDVKSPLFLPV